MSDNAKKKRKEGSGRTKGAFSFVVLSLEELNAKFNDPKQPITVGRKWAEQCGFKVENTVSAKDIGGRIAGTTPHTAVAATVTEL